MTTCNQAVTESADGLQASDVAVTVKDRTAARDKITDSSGSIQFKNLSIFQKC